MGAFVNGELPQIVVSSCFDWPRGHRSAQLVSRAAQQRSGGASLRHDAKCIMPSNPPSPTAEPAPSSPAPSSTLALPLTESLLLAAAHVNTFNGQQLLTNASGFFFQRGERLFLVTSRHVMLDEPSRHFPDRIEIEIHTDPGNMAHSTGFSIPLYRDGMSAWRQGTDSGGDVDVAVIEIERASLPRTSVYRAFTPRHLVDAADPVELGSPLLVVGFPLGFHDALHHLPVVRHAVNASSFGFRFQGKGYFLTDARTHRGTSGAPVVKRAHGNEEGLGDLPWMLLGVHSSRMDVGTRDLNLDEALGLNCAWYADILLTLTEH
jgi:hypothetical protein